MIELATEMVWSAVDQPRARVAESRRKPGPHE